MATEDNVLFIVEDPKAVDDKMDYGFKLTRWLGTNGDTVASVVWSFWDKDRTATTADLTNAQQSITNSDRDITIWIEDGVAGTTYRVEAYVTTAQGRKKTFAFLLSVVS
jgi:hypothetical protein